jgi:hypothetical protein
MLQNPVSTVGGFYRSMKDLNIYGVTSLMKHTTLKDDYSLEKEKAYGFEMMLRKKTASSMVGLSYLLSWSDRNFDKLNNGILILLNTMGDIIFQWFGI